MGEIRWVVGAGSHGAKQPGRFSRIADSAKDNLMEKKLVYMIGAGKCGEDATFPEGFGSMQVDILVAPCGFHYISF